MVFAKLMARPKVSMNLTVPGEVTDEQVTRTIDRMDLARHHGNDRISKYLSN